MIRLLPFILIPVLILGSLWYFRNFTAKQALKSSQATQITSDPVEVPKIVPGASTQERVKTLEEVITKLASQVNSLKSAGSQNSSGNSQSQLNDIQAQVTELKARVSALEKTAPQAQITSGTKYPLYIPLGGSGGPWSDQNWNMLNEYQISINTDNYSGYSGIQLEVNFRLVEAAGTGYVRLYNTTDSSAPSSEVSTTSTSFGTKTSGTFTLPGGSKTYTIQVKSSEGKQLFVQSARLKVNF